jgi:hypothetical protein
VKAWSESLEEDLRWREAELASLKRIAIVSRDNAVLYSCALRALWALLYAHFEGFTKFCWELLLDQVEVEKITIKELREDFLVLALEKPFRQMRGNLGSPSLWNFFHTELPGVLQQSAAFPPDCRLDTECNLWPNVFERECARVGIASAMLQSYSARIKTLVARRNDIAHGKAMTIKSIDEYVTYERATILILHDLAIQVLDILEKQNYLAANQANARSNRGVSP